MYGKVQPALVHREKALYQGAEEGPLRSEIQ
jgi:hypothetical protein